MEEATPGLQTQGTLGPGEAASHFTSCNSAAIWAAEMGWRSQPLWGSMFPGEHADLSVTPKVSFVPWDRNKNPAEWESAQKLAGHQPQAPRPESVKGFPSR